MSKQSLIEKIDHMPPDQIAKLEQFADELNQRNTPKQLTDQERELQFQQHLLALGIISEIKPPITDFTPYQNRQPIEVKGKPTSEVIIEDRG
jgi:hypothetical protein